MKAVVRGGIGNEASVSVPGDKSISHRSLLLSLLASGTYSVDGLSSALDVLATKDIVETLGVHISQEGSRIILRGVGFDISEPNDFLDVGNSGTLIRLISGVLAGSEGNTFFLKGDSSIGKRPMGRVIDPLTKMGAKIIGRGYSTLAPLGIVGTKLHGIDYEMPVASAQVKSAILFAGLNSSGTTTLVETVPTRAHTEEMLSQFGANLEVTRTPTANKISIEPSKLRPIDIKVPGDPSSAAFFVVLGLIGQCSIEVTDVYLGPQRDGFLKTLISMGGRIDLSDKGNGLGDIKSYPSELSGVVVGPDGTPDLIDEVPILGVAAAMARGRTEFLGVGELRHKESDRIATTCDMLASFGVDTGELDGGFYVDGIGHDPSKGVLESNGFVQEPRVVVSHYDHRIAMSGAILGALTQGETYIEGFESVETSFPTFVSVFRSCGFEIEVR
ncbi:3-phosphoshikimate 1-carboxyvinyltransferase [Acidithrix sp. C25]|uniref:3-phosphoshikimate 1-carboxyvinyltransferase n=1 Tax=Acidithrix sp. C25 TaxID=1671482 RepID=UPI00191BB878|nr:3-phosphoshikimate 1-carboxyvinyltransferase [Acidithrix sp. C25]CAG4915268.1 unnamed protein product [Acidithrix sp. C25]